MKHYMLGKKVKKQDRRNLQFARYLPMKLPNTLPGVDRASRLPAKIGMMANDRYGCCTMAAAGHMIQSWTTYAERGTQTLPDDEIVKAYLAISPNNDGAYMLDALNYWYKTGVGPDKIEAFVELAPGDLTQAKLAIQYFGGVYVGLALPASNMYGPWINPVGIGSAANGHCVNLVGYNDAKQRFKVCTWGEIWDMSYEWYQAYVEEAYATLNDISVIQASGLTPSGFKFDQLQEDLKNIKEPVSGDPIPEPVPPPVPKPPKELNIFQKLIRAIAAIFKRVYDVK